jgi:hypothetical protein
MVARPFDIRSACAVVWASEDTIMPAAHGPRLAAAFPNSRLVEIADSYTLIPVDQPAFLADHIRKFIRSNLAAAGAHERLIRPPSLTAPVSTGNIEV